MMSVRFTKKCLCRDFLRFERFPLIVIILVAFFSFDSFGSLVEAGKSTPVINTTSGPVRGEILRTVAKSLKYSSFRSIRYAEAPIGYQRFKPPVPAKPWTDVFNATVEGNACPQFNLIIRDYIGSEDCLFVNVFTPLTNFDMKNEKGKAVMVWIYGGSFISGYARTSMYGADFLIEDDVILVTLNYRLGPLGFLSLNHTNATGNAGMKDQVLALKWVNQNIEKFGGDITRITIFGNSAGSVAVDLHTLSERSKNLFHGVIAISGSPFNGWAFHTPDEAINKSFVLGSELGISTDNKEVLLQSLYNATAQELAMATHRMGEVDPPFRPTVENRTVARDHAFLLESPLDKYKSGNFTKVPYITGFTAQETAYLFTAENANENMTLQEWIEFTTFRYFSSGIDIKQRFLVAQSSNPVYYYRLSFNPAIALHELLYHVVANGSAHADDLAYMFHMPLVDLPLDETDPISITRRRIARLWTNFAKYRNPTPDGETDPIVNLTWPASGSSGIHLDIGDELSIKPRPVDALNEYLQLIGGQNEN